MWQRHVTGRRGATVRENIETSSAVLGVLAHGTKIQCYETATSAAGVARCRVVAPLRGWVSRKCLDRGDPVLEAHPPGLDAPSFVHVVVHGHGGDGSIVRDGYWRAAADRRPDCLFVAPSAPDGSWYELWLDRAGAAPYAALDGGRRRRLRTAFGVSDERGYDAARNYEFLDAHFPQLPVRRRELHGAARCLVELLDYVVDARRVDPSRVLLSGESQGGSVAAYAALQSPHALGGVVLYQTFLADQAYMLEWAARNADDLARKAKTPWFVHSGAADDVLPFADRGCASLTMERVHGSVLDFLARFPQVEIAGGGLYAGVGHGGDSAESRAALRAFYDAAFSADRRRSGPAWRGDDARTPDLEDAWYPAP